MDPLLGFLKSTEVGRIEGMKERELESGKRDDGVGEELLGGLRQNKSDSGGGNLPKVAGEKAQKWVNKGH